MARLSKNYANLLIGTEVNAGTVSYNEEEQHGAAKQAVVAPSIGVAVVGAKEGEHGAGTEAAVDEPSAAVDVVGGVSI